jgi:hypothetical protein
VLESSTSSFATFTGFGVVGNGVMPTFSKNLELMKECELPLSIELHAPTSSTQKLKLMGKGGQFTYTPTLPLMCRLPQAAYVDIGVGCNYFN